MKCSLLKKKTHIKLSHIHPSLKINFAKLFFISTERGHSETQINFDQDVFNSFTLV